MKYTFKEAEDYLNSTPKFTTKNSLDHTRECLRRLGDPQKAFRVIHVAGTNGKGSTCAYLTSILREAGYSCGLFTSPHLVDINERFQIGEVMVDDDTFLDAFHKVKELSDALVAEGNYHPTYFEMLFLMGILIFADAGVEYVILETGLGGRLDCTTAIGDPLACVITSISFDHMQYLGNTIREIASEKAGIIVPGVPVVYDGNDPEAAAVMRDTAIRLNSAYTEVTRADEQILGNTRAGIDFSMKNGYYKNTVFSIPFIAKYQVMNAALAIRTIEALKGQLSVSDEALKRGLSLTRWQGRMETILPGVVVDGAHNEDGIEKFVETAEHFGQEHTIHLLFSAVEDKDYKDMIHTIASRIRPAHVVVTSVGGYRKVDAEHLASFFRNEDCACVEAIEDIEKALDRALECREEDDMLFCAGSLYLVGEIKSILKKRGLA